jgi:hypothetical protein
MQVTIMPIELTLQRDQSGALRPVNNLDLEELNKFKVGQAVRVTVTRVSPRSLAHHQKYWAGLITLCMDYWEPKGGLISASEKATLRMFASWLDSKGNDSGSFRGAARDFLSELVESRSSKIAVPEKSKEALHKWIKEEAGYFKWVLTPTGLRKEVDSINFASMDQEKFNVFYKSAFNIIWKFVLSRKFDTKDDAEKAVDHLLSLLNCRY